MSLLRSRLFWGGLLLGIAAATAALEVPYINWHKTVPPLEGPVTIREDAKGDGHFAAPRSGNRRHRGVDFAAPIGTPVRAIRSGIVLEVGAHRGFGHFIVLGHRQNLRSLYAHLNDVQVEAGRKVRQGQVIVTVGKTGNAWHPWITPHLHFEVVKAGEPINPQVMLSSAEQVDGRGGE